MREGGTGLWRKVLTDHLTSQHLTFLPGKEASSCRTQRSVPREKSPQTQPSSSFHSSPCSVCGGLPISISCGAPGLRPLMAHTLSALGAGCAPLGATNVPGTRARSLLEMISVGSAVRHSWHQKRLLVHQSRCLQGASSASPVYGDPDFIDGAEAPGPAGQPRALSWDRTCSWQGIWTWVRGVTLEARFLPPASTVS